MSIEEKYDEVKQLISIGKEKGYLLYDEVNELLPADITSSDELDDLFSTFGSAGIEVVDSEQKYREDKLLDRTGEGAEELELDLTPGALDKTNDPVRMYLREMGTVPLLTREGEVEIAKRIERGKLAVIKSISRTPTVARAIMTMGDHLKNEERSIRELVIVRRRRADRRQDRGPQAAGPAPDRGRQEVVDGPREVQGEAREDAARHDDARQAEVPARPVGSVARARRALAAHPPHRVHRGREAPPDRPDQGIGRGGDARASRDRSARASAQSQEQEEQPAEGRGEEEPLQASERAQGPGQDDGRRPRGDARSADADDRDDPARRDPGRAGQEGARRGQPAAGRVDRQEVHRTAACSSST